MKEYRYSAARLDGKRVRGRIFAASCEQAKAQLSKDGLYPIKCGEIYRRSPSRLSDREVSDFCRELSSLLRSGVSVTKSIEIITQGKHDNSVKAAYKRILMSVTTGGTLGGALSKEDRLFPQTLIGMVEVGEQGGRLEQSLSRMAEYYERLYRVKTEIRSAMAYPVILLVMTLLVIVAVFAFIFPLFADLFSGMELPAITLAMMWISDLFTKHYIELILLSVAVIAIVWWLSGTAAVRKFAAGIKFRLPIFGSIFRIIATADFARVYSALYSGGMNVLRALELSEAAVNDSYISGKFPEVIGRVRAGMPLSEAIAAIDCFDVKLSSVTAVGEQSGRLDEMLNSLSESLDYEARSAVKRLLKFLEPVMIIVMAAIILTVVLSVMIPIYTMYGQLGAGII